MKAFTFSSTHLLDNIELNLYTCGHEQCEPNHAYGPAVRSGYLFHFVLSGTGQYTLLDKTYQVHAGSGFLIPPNARIFYQADSTHPWSYMWIGVAGTKIDTYLQQTTINAENPIFPFESNPILVEKLEAIIAASQLQTYKNLKIFSTLYDFFYELSEQFPNKTISHEVKQLHYIEDALRFIHTHYQDSLFIQDIAKHLSIDRSYLHRLFKQQLHMSPQQYVTQFRIEQAIQLLQTTTLTIGDIARSVGYTDTLLFSKMFKKMTGLSPKDYRIKHNPIKNTPLFVSK